LLGPQSLPPGQVPEEPDAIVGLILGLRLRGLSATLKLFYFAELFEESFSAEIFEVLSLVLNKLQTLENCLERFKFLKDSQYQKYV
jgi:hypothetical protein